MRKLFLPATLVAVLVTTAIASDQTSEDRYVACVIGNGAVYIHKKATVEEAATKAFADCVSLEGEWEDPADGNEGLSDFIYMTLKKIADPA